MKVAQQPGLAVVSKTAGARRAAVACRVAAAGG